MHAKLAVLVTALLLIAADDEVKDAAKKDVKKLEGSWTPTSLIYNGKDMTDNKKTQFRFVFKGNEAIVEGSKDVKKEYARIKVKLDPTSNPHLIDISVGGGVQEGLVIEGIYEMKGDELKICAKVLGNERPAEFASPEGSSIVLLVLKKDIP